MQSKSCALSVTVTQFSGQERRPGVNARGGREGKGGCTAQGWSLASLSTYALGRDSPEHASPSASHVTTFSLHPKGKTHLPPSLLYRTKSDLRCEGRQEKPLGKV